MTSNRSIALAALIALFSSPVSAAADEAAPVAKSTSTAGIMLGGNPGWTSWLKDNYTLKAPLDEGQMSALKRTGGAAWDRRFVGDLFKDGTPGVLLVKLSPSGKTASRLEVLRWEKDAWSPLILCGQKKLVYGKHPPITSSEPIDVYQVYLQREPEGLGFMITFGNAGDKLFGDAVSLSYEGKERGYVEPDDTDHD